MVASGSEELWAKAFQLAFFLVPDRASAWQITSRAAEKLGVQRSREKRRIYWRGRNRKLRIRRITRPDADALQWLVYLESEECEKEQERNDQQTELDMVIRYIKHMVQLTTSASSFYVNVGLNRLLRNYSTPEVQQVYELTTEHYPASEEYRKVKGRLMNRLAVRFDRFLKTHTSEYRELRFEAYKDQKPWVRVVEECLEAFTPWSSREACLRGALELEFGDPGTGVHHRSSPNHADGIETNRCHWFMHSPCYGELARKLELDPPDQRLAVPQFFLKESRGQDPGDSGGRRKITPLTDAEMRALKDRLDLAEARRQQAPLRRLKIIAHGTVYAHLDPVRNEKRQFDIPDGTKVLEVWTETDGTDLILATHWIDYTEQNGIAAGEYTIALKEGRELFLNIQPAGPGTEQEGGATVAMESRSSSALSAFFDAMSSSLKVQRNLPGYAFAALMCLVVGWLAATAHYRSKMALQQNTVAQMTAEIASLKTPTEKQGPPHSAGALTTYFFASGNPSLRGTDNPEELVVNLAAHDPLVMLDLAALGEHGSYRATLSSFPQEQELLRQNLLRPIKKHNDWVVEFALPSALVADRTHYLITVDALDSGGRATPVSRFLFEVRK